MHTPTTTNLADTLDSAAQAHRRQAKERQKVHGDTAPGKAKNTSGHMTGSDSGDSRDKAGQAARARELYEERAKERMAEGGKAAGRGRPQQGKENLPYPIDAGQARDQAGKAAGVSGATQEVARTREFYEEQAKERMAEGQKHGGKARHGSTPENLPESTTGDSRDKAGQAARARELYEEQAKERQGERTDKHPGKFTGMSGDSRDKAGQAAGVSGKSVDYASRVITSGSDVLEVQQ